MSDSPNRNLALQLGDFGPLVIQPEDANDDEIGRARYILFPDKIPQEKFAAALEWASVSESPVFCTSADLKRFEDEGFGAYRFNALGGFRELGFERGTLRFVPARRKQGKGWLGLVEDLADAWGWSRREAYHVIIKAPGKRTILYLTTPFVNKTEWAVLCEDKPERIIGSAQFGRLYWTALAERIGANIEIPAMGSESRGSTTTKIFGLRGASSDAGRRRPTQKAPKGGPAWNKIDQESGS
jgi:hypothetical protein